MSAGAGGIVPRRPAGAFWSRAARAPRRSIRLAAPSFRLIPGSEHRATSPGGAAPLMRLPREDAVAKEPSIPTRAEMEAFVEFGRAFHFTSLRDLSATIEPTEEGIRQFALEAWRIYKSLYEPAPRLKALKWLESQESFRAAMKRAANGSGNRYVFSSDIDAHREKFLAFISRNALISLLPLDQRPTDVPRNIVGPKDQLWWHGSYRPLEFSAGIVAAFNRYYYDDPEEEILRVALIEKARKSIEEIRKALERDVVPALPAVRKILSLKSNLFLEDRLKPLQKCMARLAQDADMARWLSLPNMRRDETLAERLLAWDLRQAFRAMYRTEKTGAICLLFDMPSIRREVAERTIERWVENWPKPPKRRTAVEPEPTEKR